MKKALIWGAGNKLYEHWLAIKMSFDIVGIIDSDTRKQGTHFGDFIIGDKSLLDSLNYDYILIVPNEHKFEIISELSEMKDYQNKILPYFGYKNNMEYSSFLTKRGVQIIGTKGKHPFKCYLKNSSDFEIFEDIFLKDVYSFSGWGKYVVFDIGMNIGLAAIYFASQEIVEHVYAFEPFFPTYNQALENIKINDALVKEKITTFQVALSNYNGEYAFKYMKDHPGGMSILGNSAESYNGEDTCRASIANAAETLEPLLDKHTSNKIVLKIDTEGSEYDILYILEDHGLLNRINIFIIETHGLHVREIQEIMQRNRFTFFQQYSTGVPELGMMYAVRDR